MIRIKIYVFVIFIDIFRLFFYKVLVVYIYIIKNDSLYIFLLALDVINFGLFVLLIFCMIVVFDYCFNFGKYILKCRRF